MIRTAEFVTPKHPDKCCDIISDAILDECLRQDPYSRVAVETMGGHGIITITGEITTNAFIDIPKIVHRIAGDTLGVQVNLVKQSNEIKRGVDSGGAGDQGIMVGYACAETRMFMPFEYFFARELLKELFKKFPYDGKVQVTEEDGYITTEVVSIQNTSKKDIFTELKRLKTPKDLLVLCNEAGDWNQGGFDADTGLTGRKIVIDSYGPRVPVGGGAFSGKDPTKVDRSGAYMARKIAVDYLRKSGAKEAKCELAYVIGKQEPVQATITLDGKQENVQGYDLRPQAIIELLDLRKPIYEETAKWGNFGNGFNWDK